ncbi:MAG: hypothetical protein E7629_08640 [Ruminococcaceae bacterium]|nr:hypothetical protein [Oscillospiraceae bacterium]
MRSNEEIRRAIGAAGLKQYQVASALGMLDGNFSRKLRNELPQKEKEHILQVIKSLERAEVNA